MMIGRSVLGLVLGVSVASCTSDRDAVAGDVIRTVAGDTTIVRNLGHGVWRGSAKLVEEVSVGALDGAEEYLFGQILDLAVDAEGGLYVFDGQAPALRYFDRRGAYVRTLGREGQGPGEYRDASLGLAIRRADGRVVMRDPRNARLNVYNPDGSVSDSWPVESGLFTSQAMMLDTSDHMFLRILTGRPEPNSPWPIALLHMDERGQILDTIVPPVLPNEPGGVSAYSKVWTVGLSGGLVIGVNDRYSIRHYRPDGTVLRIERDVAPIAYLPEEKAERAARNAWRMRTQGEFMTSELPATPDTKPFYRSLSVGAEGRLWVERYTEAEEGPAIQTPAPPGVEPPPPSMWREPRVYDVFEVDGTFLGSVRVPGRTDLSVFRGDRVWGVRTGEFDEQYVVGYRLVPN